MRLVVHHTPPPEILAAYAADPNPSDPAVAWKNFSGKEEVRDALWPIQKGRCAYCELCIPCAHTPIEHIKPKSRTRFPGMTFVYTNLVLNCNDTATCTTHKGDLWDGRFIAPTDPRCETFLSYERDGHVRPSAGLLAPDREAVSLTCRLVNLNHPGLVTKRAEILEAIEEVCASLMSQVEALKAYLRSELDVDTPAPFFSLKKQHFGTPGPISQEHP